MVKVLRARRDRKFKSHGEILYGADYLEDLADLGSDINDRVKNWMALREAKAVLLSILHVNTWEALRGIGIDVSALRDAVRYQCPYTQHEYFWMMPISLFGDVEKYKEKAKETLPDWKVDHAFDFEYTCFATSCESPVDWYFGDVTSLFMGSGYTVGTLYTDGSRNRRRLRVRLSDGNWFMVETWEWFNK